MNRFMNILNYTKYIEYGYIMKVLLVDEILQKLIKPTVNSFKNWSLEVESLLSRAHEKKAILPL